MKDFMSNVRNLAHVVLEDIGYMLDAHSAENHPHELREAFTPEAAAVLRGKVERGDRMRVFAKEYRRVKRELLSELGDEPTAEQIRNRFFSTQEMKTMWVQNEIDMKKNKEIWFSYESWRKDHPELLVGDEDADRHRFSIYFINSSVLPSLCKRLGEIYFDDRLPQEAAEEVPEPAPNYVGTSSIKSVLEIIGALDFEKPSTIKFDVLVKEGFISIENDTPSIQIPKDGDTILVSYDEFLSALDLNRKLFAAYREKLLMDAFSPLILLNKELLSAKSDTERNQIVQSIRNLEVFFG